MGFVCVFCLVFYVEKLGRICGFFRRDSHRFSKRNFNKIFGHVLYFRVVSHVCARRVLPSGKL